MINGSGNISSFRACDLHFGVANDNDVWHLGTCASDITVKD